MLDSNPLSKRNQRSWKASRGEIEARNYDLKAVNPNRVAQVDTRTPWELIATIEASGNDIDNALASLKKLL